LARASAAEGNARATQQQAQCDSTLKALVALTAIAEQDLKQKMAAAPADHAQAAMISVATLPASVLAQRPDVYAAERDVAAASFDVGSAQAQRYPRLMLNGSIGTLNYTNAAGTTDLSTWSIGPISVSLPILDGGRRVANVEAAQARYLESAAVYQGKVRQAVREVEDTLLTLASADARMMDATSAAEGYTASFNATQARYKAGSASLPELEDARRIALAAQNALLQLALERTTTWVSLYRVLGGGWNANASAMGATASAKTAPQ
jgi:outer membrane protein, multidrug efflux system